MRITTSIAVLLVAVFCIHYSTEAAQTTIAVLDFENNSFFKAEEYDPLTKGLAEMFVTELSSLEALQVVERQKLKSVLDELKLSQSGLISEKNSTEVGKLLGAHHLVFGGYMVTMDEKIRIDVRVVEVETGLTLNAGQETGKTKDILRLIQKLSTKIVKDLNVQLSKNEERSLKKSKAFDMQAVVYYSKGVEYEDNGQLREAYLSYKQALEIEPEFNQVKKRISLLVQKAKEQKN